MTSAPRSVTVLGSTGSVGTQTVQLLAAEPERFRSARWSPDATRGYWRNRP